MSVALSIAANVFAGYSSKKNGLGTGIKLAAVTLAAISAPRAILGIDEKIENTSAQSVVIRLTFGLILLGAYTAGENIVVNDILPDIDDIIKT